MKDCFVNSPRHSAKIHCLLVPSQWETISLGLWQCIPTFLLYKGKEGGSGEVWKERRRKRGTERQKEKQRTRLESVTFDLELGIPSYTCLLYSWLKVRLSKRRKRIEEKNSGSLSFGQPVPRTAEMGVTHCAKLRLPCEQSSVSVFRVWGYRSGIMLSLVCALHSVWPPGHLLRSSSSWVAAFPFRTLLLWSPFWPRPACHHTESQSFPARPQTHYLQWACMHSCLPVPSSGQGLNLIVCFSRF